MADTYGAASVVYGEIRGSAITTLMNAPSDSLVGLTGCTNVEPVASNAVTPDKANSKITVAVPGLYRVRAQVSMTCSAAQTHTLEIKKLNSAGTASALSPAARGQKLTATGDTQPLLVVETVVFLDAGEGVALYGTATGGNWTLKEVSFSVLGIG